MSEISKGNTKMSRQNVPLSAIHPHVAAQPRTSVNIDKVGEYVDDIARGDKFPPMVVFHDGENYWLADGFHRYYAAKTAKLETFSCEVREGGLRDAILYSCGANAAHGLRRSNQDKRRAVSKLLDDPEWAKWSNSEIARRCGVDEGFVRKVKADHHRVTSDIRSENSDESSSARTYTTKHGTEAVMNVTNIGRSPRQTPAIEPQTIANALHDIERRIDTMPSPQEAAERFPEDRRYLFPVAKLEEMAAWLVAFAALMKQRMVDQVNARNT